MTSHSRLPAANLHPDPSVAHLPDLRLAVAQPFNQPFRKYAVGRISERLWYPLYATGTYHPPDSQVVAGSQHRENNPQILDYRYSPKSGKIKYLEFNKAA